MHAKTHTGFHLKCSLFLLDYNQNFDLSTNFSKTAKYLISRKSVGRISGCFMRYRQTDGQALRRDAVAPNKREGIQSVPRTRTLVHFYKLCLNEACCVVFFSSISESCASNTVRRAAPWFSLEIPVSSGDSLTPFVALIPYPLNLFISLFQLLQSSVAGNTTIPLGKENAFRK
jgi:hypothetical protein